MVSASLDLLCPLSTTLCSPTFIRQDDNFMFPRNSTCEMPQVCSINCASDRYQDRNMLKSNFL